MKINCFWLGVIILIVLLSLIVGNTFIVYTIWVFQRSLVDGILWSAMILGFVLMVVGLWRECR